MEPPEILNESRPKRRVHKRTLAIVFCFVILPWILVAVPGEEFLRWGGGIPGRSGVCYTHGWPFQHLVRNEAIVDGAWVNRTYIHGQIPPQLELDKLARESLRDQPSLKLNLKFRKVENFDSRDDWGPVVWDYKSKFNSRPQWPTAKSDGTGFWTAPFKWFKSGTGHYWEIQPLGLVCNLIILALATLFVGWIVERKLARQGRIFKFSLRALLLATAFVAIGISWLVQEFSRFQKHHQQVDYFSSERTFTSSFYNSLHVDAKYKSRFPLVVSQLLNHGELPFVDSKFFVALDSQDPGTLYICLFFDQEMDLQKIQEIAQLAAESPFSVQLYIKGYGRQIEKSLVDFKNVSLMELDIQFHTPDGVDSFGDHEKYTGDYSKDLEFSGDRVNITADFPHLKRLTLSLSTTLDQASQLKSFRGLNSLEEAKLVSLSQPGVDFLLKTKEEWPRKIEFEFTPNVSEASKELLWQHFDRTYKFGG